LTKRPSTDNLSLMKVNLNKGICIGCGACTAVAPKTFKLAQDGKAETIEPVTDDQVVVKQAAEGCPVQAITVEE